MVFRGAYDDINGVRRPYITILVRSYDGTWIPLPFLIDSGADATFLDASCLQQIGTSPGAVVEQTASGVGGKVTHMQIATALRFASEDGTKTFSGTIGIFTDPAACDTPVLGQDVLDHFRVIFDQSRNAILLLAPPHDYEVVVR
jgi:Aspartyl protease